MRASKCHNCQLYQGAMMLAFVLRAGMHGSIADVRIRRSTAVYEQTLPLFGTGAPRGVCVLHSAVLCALSTQQPTWLSPTAVLKVDLIKSSG
jgi:hypothetical protein